LHSLAPLARFGLTLLGDGLPSFRQRLLSFGGRTTPAELTRSLALAALGIGCNPWRLVVPDGLGEAKPVPPFAYELLDFLG